jgi:hypothetical protein
MGSPKGIVFTAATTLLAAVHAGAVSSTSNMQVPWSNSSLLGVVYLRTNR